MIVGYHGGLNHALATGNEVVLLGV